MRGRVGNAVAVTGLLLLTGCGWSDGLGETTATIEGLRSDPDHRGLVASYTGGACDGSTRLAVTETPVRIDVDVVVGSGRRHSDACPAVGIPRTVGARLAQPIGQRTIWSGGRQQVPFDGALVLTPSTVPPSFTGLREGGSAEASAPSDGSVEVTTTWQKRYSDVVTEPANGRCQPSRGSVEVLLRPVSAHTGGHRTRVGTPDLGAVEAGVYRLGSSAEPEGWAYVWTASHHQVEVSTSPRCVGDRLLTRAELLRVAESLRPGVA